MRRVIARAGRHGGFTLIEVMMVIVIMGILSTIALRSVQSGIESSRIRATQGEMEELAFAIAGNADLYANGMRSDFGYVGDVGALPSSLDDLVTNPGGYATWNGPYVNHQFTQDPTGYKKDAWGNTYGFTGGITMSSTGGGSTPMTKSIASLASDLTSTTISGTITDAGGNPPGDSSVAVSIVVTYPDGAGGTTTATTNPSSGGAFSFSGIPVGIRSVEAVYRAGNDTINAFACVLPRTGATLGLRLPNAPFAVTGGGGGGGSGSIEYVSGSAVSKSGGQKIEFDITNTSGSSIQITSLIATYAPAIYYKKVKWDGPTVFDENNPRAGSGDTATFTSTQTIAAGATITVKLEGFKDAPTGGNDADASNTDFTITFSDGSVITFNSGP